MFKIPSDSWQRVLLRIHKDRKNLLSSPLEELAKSYPQSIEKDIQILLKLDYIYEEKSTKTHSTLYTPTGKGDDYVALYKASRTRFIISAVLVPAIISILCTNMVLWFKNLL